jgi:ankyrin repeat protein
MKVIDPRHPDLSPVQAVGTRDAEPLRRSCETVFLRANPLCWLVASLMAACVALPSRAASATDLLQAIRRGDKPAIRAHLTSGVPVNARDEWGNTALMAAALNADAAVVELLLKAGAEGSATNKAGATALLRAATDEQKVRLLVDHNADIKARSQLGNTALHLAARQHGSVRTVKLLLDKGAEVNATNIYGATALMAAAAAEDLDTIRLLLDRGADVNARPNLDGDGFIWGGGRTALMWAAFRGNERLIKLLLARGARVNDFTLVGSALAQAAWNERADAARVLLEAGAKVDERDLIANYTPLHWAASSEHTNASLVALLLAYGADANAEGGQPVDGFLGMAQTPLMLARKRGETPIVEALLRAGARNASRAAGRPAPKLLRPAAGPIDDAAIASAIQSAVPTLQKTAAESYDTFRRHVSKQDCVSCHQQQLPMAAIGLAHSRRVSTDRDAARRQIEAVMRDIARFQERDLQTTFHPEPAIGDGYALFGLRFEQQPASAVTDAYVHHLATIQSQDGRWFYNLPRPPVQSSDIGATALAVHALKFYAPPGQQRGMEKRVQRARAWLREARTENNEERAYQLLGLAWAGETTAKLQQLANQLINQQRTDGGWAPLPNLGSDAFATGQSLYALMRAGGLPEDHPAVRRGVRFLLETQLADGTWLVRRRAFPFQPPMNSSFPHGADSWISSAGTSWAVMGLASALDPSHAPRAGATVSKIAAATSLQPSSAVEEIAAPVEFTRDIKPLLERSCVSCHSGQRPKGGYHLDSRQGLLKGGNRGEAAVIASRSDQSPLLRFVSDQVEDLEMPPLPKREKFPALSHDEIGRLRAWIDQGAVWPEGLSLRSPAKGSP